MRHDSEVSNVSTVPLKRSRAARRRAARNVTHCDLGERSTHPSRRPGKPHRSEARVRGRDVAARRRAAPLLHAGPRVEAPRALMGRTSAMLVRSAGPDGKVLVRPGPHSMWARSGAGVVCFRAHRCGRHVGSSALPGPPPAAVVLSSVPPAPSTPLSDTLAHQAEWPGPWHHERRRPLVHGVEGNAALQASSHPGP